MSTQFNNNEHDRSATRHRVLKAAKILFSDWRTIDVGVRDLSAKGARLMISIPDVVPERIRVHILAENFVKPAKVVWRRPDSIGVEFTGDAERPETQHLQKPVPGSDRW